MSAPRHRDTAAVRPRMGRWLWLLVVGMGCFFAWSSVYSVTDNMYRSTTDITYTPGMSYKTKDRTQVGQEKACLYMLVRNFELHSALSSIRQIEDRFNWQYHYPWVFLNDEPFDDQFKELTQGMASGEVKYGYIDPEDWNVPPHINQTRMRESMKSMEERDVIYGGSLSYRNMCHYNSGGFMWHPLLQKYDWYWRVEPGINFYCDLEYDPFTFLRDNGKIYGFVITIPDVHSTVPSLWSTAKQFFDSHPQYIAEDNALGFVLDWDGWQDIREETERAELHSQVHGVGYNLCHFWSNFEIGSFDFFRGEAYTSYFRALDAAGGFYYERWGDAPVHTLGLVALTDRTQIHHFSDIGYYHPPFWRCPHDRESYTSGRCLCPTAGIDMDNENIDFEPFSCLPRWWRRAGRQHVFNFTTGLRVDHPQDPYV